MNRRASWFTLLRTVMPLALLMPPVIPDGYERDETIATQQQPITTNDPNSNGESVDSLSSLVREIARLESAVDFWNTATIVMMVVAALSATALVATQWTTVRRSKALAVAQGKLIDLKDTQLRNELRAKDEKLTRELRDKDESIAKAVRETEELRKQTEELKEKNLDLEFRLERERENRIHLQESVAPRSVSTLYNETRLNRFAGTPIKVLYREGDLEARYLADTIAGAVSDAGWDGVLGVDDLVRYDGYGVRLLPSDHDTGSERKITDAARELESLLLANFVYAKTLSWKWCPQLGDPPETGLLIVLTGCNMRPLWAQLPEGRMLRYAGGC